MANADKRLKKADIPEIKKLYEGLKIGVDYITKKLGELQSDECETDPNDVVKWIKESYSIAQNVIAFYELIYGDDDDDGSTIRGGARVNPFEMPSSGRITK